MSFYFSSQIKFFRCVLRYPDYDGCYCNHPLSDVIQTPVMERDDDKPEAFLIEGRI